MKRKRININIYDGITDSAAISFVSQIIEGGRISGNGKSYCYGTVSSSGIQCSAEVNKSGSDSFHVSKTDSGDIDGN